MSLIHLTIQDEYRSSEHSIIQDFYIPCFEQSIAYRRSVGFFTSTSMALAAKGLTALIKSGGTMQLIASPLLSNEDIEAIERGIQQREEVIAKAIVQELEKEFDRVVENRLACLSWLLSKSLLDIKLAVPQNLKAKGIYHEKLGIFLGRSPNLNRLMTQNILIVLPLDFFNSKSSTNAHLNRGKAKG